MAYVMIKNVGEVSFSKGVKGVCLSNLGARGVLMYLKVCPSLRTLVLMTYVMIAHVLWKMHIGSKLYDLNKRRGGLSYLQSHDRMKTAKWSETHGLARAVSRFKPYRESVAIDQTSNQQKTSSNSFSWWHETSYWNRMGEVDCERLSKEHKEHACSLQGDYQGERGIN